MRLLAHLRHVVDFCYPRVCAVCDAAGLEDGQLCESCDDELRRLERAAACGRCAMPLAHRGSPCPYCGGKGHKPFERIVRLGVFEDPIKHLIHQIKYHNRWPLAEFLAERMLGQEDVKGLLTEADVLVPVPLHPLRQMSRGYNQADLVARRVGKLCGLPVAHALVRLEHTETQTHIHSKEQRYENLRDAFGLMRTRPVRGRHVVLIDDVMTTGATLTWAARTLADAEPASISAMILAIADPRGRGFEAI